MFESLWLTWATATGRLRNPTICPPHKDGGISLCTFPKDTENYLAFSLHNPFCIIRYARKL